MIISIFYLDLFWLILSHLFHCNQLFVKGWAGNAKCNFIVRSSVQPSLSDVGVLIKLVFLSHRLRWLTLRIEFEKLGLQQTNISKVVQDILLTKGVASIVWLIS